MKKLTPVKRMIKSKAKILALLLATLLIVSTTAGIAAAYEWPDRNLSFGMSGDDVATLQTALSDLGYYNAALDGDFGSYTEQALINYQSDYGLYADGVAGPITLTSLYGEQSSALSSPATADTGSSTAGSNTSSSSGTLSFGSSGTYVTALQSKLESLGYATGGVDGIFGGMTEAAVIAFQKANGLYVDGIAGPITLSALFSDSAVSGSSSDNSNTAAQTSASTTDSSSTTDQSASTGTISRSLQYGMNGNDVTTLQKLLAAQGYYNGAIDGDFGGMTESAVIAFQQAEGLYVDGIAGPITLKALNASSASGSSSSNNTEAQTSASTTASSDNTNPSSVSFTRSLQYGATGDDVTALQKLLAAQGYYNGAIDGDFGVVTKSAVIAFQQAEGLYVDGIAGPITLAALNSNTSSSNTNTPSTTSTQENDKDTTPTEEETPAEQTTPANVDTPALGQIFHAKGGIKFNWFCEGATNFRVYRMDSNGEWAQLAETTETSYLDTSVENGSTYSYTVQAISADGSSTLSDYNDNGLTLTYTYTYDSLVANAPTQVSKERVEELAKAQGFGENEIIALIGWVDGEGYIEAGDPYLAYLSGCVLINSINEGHYGDSEEILETIATWGSYYTVDKMKARYEDPSDAALLACYLALANPVSGIHYCRGWSSVPEDCYYDSCIVAHGMEIYVW